LADFLLGIVYNPYIANINIAGKAINMYLGMNINCLKRVKTNARTINAKLIVRIKVLKSFVFKDLNKPYKHIKVGITANEKK
jgi:hypothetical protein